MYVQLWALGMETGYQLLETHWKLPPPLMELARQAPLVCSDVSTGRLITARGRLQLRKGFYPRP